jgi:hypothetical protein
MRYAGRTLQSWTTFTDHEQLTDPDGRDPEAWLSHLSGIATLLQARGALRHRSMLARSTLEHCRYNLVSLNIVLSSPNQITEHSITRHNTAS